MFSKKKSILYSLLIKIGLKKRRKEKHLKNYKTLVDSFTKKVYSQ